MTRAGLAYLRSLGACPEAIAWARRYTTPQRAWRACRNPHWMLWAIDATANGWILCDRAYEAAFSSRLVSPIPRCAAIRRIVPRVPMGAGK